MIEGWALIILLVSVVVIYCIQNKTKKKKYMFLKNLVVVAGFVFIIVYGIYNFGMYMYKTDKCTYPRTAKIISSKEVIDLSVRTMSDTYFYETEFELSGKKYKASGCSFEKYDVGDEIAVHCDVNNPSFNYIEENPRESVVAWCCLFDFLLLCFFKIYDSYRRRKIQIQNSIT